MTQLGSPATQSGHGDIGGRLTVRASRMARRRVLLGLGIAAALLAVGGLTGASFVKSPQQHSHAIRAVIRSPLPMLVTVGHSLHDEGTVQNER